MRLIGTAAPRANAVMRLGYRLRSTAGLSAFIDGRRLLLRYRRHCTA